MFSRKLLTLSVFLIITTTASLFARANASPVYSLDAQKNSSSELEDLTAAKRIQSTNANSAAESSEEEHTFTHRDEEQLNSATNLVLAQNLKYDVEILESDDDRNNKQNIQNEEQFRGDGLQMTDNLYAENIEVSPIDVNERAIKEGHMLLSIVLIAIALISVGLYAALVIWRSHLEQRYGMRELLVSPDDEADEQRSQHAFPSISRHYTLVQA